MGCGGPRDQNVTRAYRNVKHEQKSGESGASVGRRGAKRTRWCRTSEDTNEGFSGTPHAVPYIITPVKHILVAEQLGKRARSWNGHERGGSQARESRGETDWFASFLLGEAT